MAALADCLGGPQGPLPGSCAADAGLLDWNLDGDVDLADFATFQRHYSGSQ